MFFIVIECSFKRNSKPKKWNKNFGDWSKTKKFKSFFSKFKTRRRYDWWKASFKLFSGRNTFLRINFETNLRRQKRQTEEKLRQIARTAEKIKNASQQKIRMVTCRAENAENELTLAKEKIFNMESELILLRDDSANLR